MSRTRKTAISVADRHAKLARWELRRKLAELNAKENLSYAEALQELALDATLNPLFSEAEEVVTVDSGCTTVYDRQALLSSLA